MSTFTVAARIGRRPMTIIAQARSGQGPALPLHFAITVHAIEIRYKRRKNIMPFSRCPVCGREFHLQVRHDLKEWYEKFAPEREIGELVNVHCFECWKVSEKPEEGDV